MRTALARLATLAAAGTAAVTLAAPVAGAVTPTGAARGVTTVTLDTATVSALEGLGVAPAPVTPAVLGGSPLQAAFPIVGNQKAGVVKHVGGLSLTGGGETLTLTNYDIVLSGGVLTADAALNGTDLGRINLFDLASAPAGFSCSGVAAELTLDAAAAGALSQVFGAPDLTGADIGTACVTPR